MRNCPAFEDLSQFVDGHLSNERELEVRRHLDVCDVCPRMLHTLSVLKQAVGRGYASESPPTAVRLAVMTPGRRRRWWRWWWFGLAATLLATVDAPRFHAGRAPHPGNQCRDAFAVTRFR